MTIYDLLFLAGALASFATLLFFAGCAWLAVALEQFVL